MKRIVCTVLALIMIVSLLSVTAFAATASASLTGPGTVRAGDTITLTFKLSGSSLYGASGTLSYDSNQLTLTGTAQKVSSPWMVEFNGNNFVAYDNNLTNPISSATALFTVTFKVKSDLATGTAIKVSYTDVLASDGSADASVGTVTYSATIAAPLSTDSNLKSLTVKNATISPAFNSSTTSYSAEVPYEVSKLDISAVANDSKAKVSIDNPTLTVNGTTKVTVKVTAEDGSTKTYTISVKRAQDPNYVPSGENNLSSITVDGFYLSPVFSKDVTEYVIWLPYETENVTVKGTAADSKASVEVIGGENLIAGQDNLIQVVCTAENGSQKIYNITAKRAAAHGEETTQPTETEPVETEPTETEPTETEPVETEPTVTQPTETKPVATKPAGNQTVDTGGTPTWLLIAFAVICIAAGAVGLFLPKKKNDVSKPEE